MVSEIQFGGLASGLDTRAIVAALVAVERRPIGLLETRRSGYEEQLQALGTFLEKLKKLEEALEPLSDPRSFASFSSTQSDPGAFEVNFTGSVIAGTYQVSVDALAQNTLLRTTNAYANTTDSLGSGTLTIQVGSEQQVINVGPGSDSLLDVKDAINALDLDVNASVVFDGTSYHLEVRGAKTGVANAVSVTASLGAGGAVFQEDRAAQDAQVTIDSLAFTSEDNVFEEAIPGLALNVLATSELDSNGAPVPGTLTLGEDFGAIEKKVQEFLTAYNDVARFIASQSSRSTEDEDAPAPPLLGDSTLRLLQNDLGRTLTTQLDSSLGAVFDSLASLGIRSNPDGTLKLDSEDFQDALSQDLEGVTALFTDASHGIGVALRDKVGLRTDRIDGVIKLRQDTIRRTIDDLDDRIERAEDRLVRFEESLTRRYAAFETLIGRLQSQGTALSAIGLGLR